jgi:very-short-patch-repair endonuclease
MRYDRSGKAENRQRAKRLRRSPTGPESILNILLKDAGQAKILKRWVMGRVIPPISLPFRNLLIFLEREGGLRDPVKSERRANWLKGQGFNVLEVTRVDLLEKPQAVIAAVEAFPESEDNRRVFFASRRSAARSSYWVED